MRPVFDLPLRLRRTYMAAIQLIDERASAPGNRDPSAVRDVDIAGVTLLHLSETRLHLLDLGNDLLLVAQDGEHVCVTGPARSSTGPPRRARPRP